MAEWSPSSILSLKLDIQERTSHYVDVIMTSMASQITSFTVVYFQSFILAQIKENIKAPRHLPLCGNSSGPVNSPQKGPVTRKMFPFDDVIMGIVSRWETLACHMISFYAKLPTKTGGGLWRRTTPRFRWVSRKNESDARWSWTWNNLQVHSWRNQTRGTRWRNVFQRIVRLLCPPPQSILVAQTIFLKAAGKRP